MEQSQTDTGNDGNMSVPVMEEGDLIKLNLRGSVFLIRRSSLSKDCSTRLAYLTETDIEYNPGTKEYYFDRNPVYFHYILDYHITGQLHFPSYFCPNSIIKEIQFWEIKTSELSQCCWKTLFSPIDDDKIYQNLSDLETKEDRDEKTLTWRMKLWRFLTDVSSSIYAKIWFYFMMFIILLGLVGLTLSSMAVFRQTAENSDINSTTTATKFETLIRSKPHDSLYYILILTNVFYIVDMIMRIISCPGLKTFVKDFHNVSEIFAIISTIMFSFIHEDLIDGEDIRYLYMALVFFVSLRAFRLLRLAENAHEMKILALAVKASIKELFILLLVIGTFSFIFGSIMFNVELTVNDTFPDLLTSVWWAIITMTSVGYGDHYPTSPQGYLVASFTAVFGLMLLALPIAIIASNFNAYYYCYKIRQNYYKAKS